MRALMLRILILCQSVIELTASVSSRNIPSFLERRSNFEKINIDFINHRVLEQSEETSCDAAFMKCVSDKECFKCYDTLRTQGVDWATVNPWAPCSDVLTFLNNGGFCKNFSPGKASHDMFCNTFDACVVWTADAKDENKKKKKDDGNDDSENKEKKKLDCSTLTSCLWEGMHTSFLGDGKCHDFECYNTEVCNYDGGDCCEDTCDLNVPYQYSSCGGEGYYCRNPNSKMCDPNLELNCVAADYDEYYDIEECEDDMKPYVIQMYDSWGDGWSEVFLKISSEEKGEVYNGQLTSGDHGTDSVCLEKGCYQVSCGGGIWGNEIAWEIHQGAAGSGPPLAYGGSPMDCEFSVGANTCKNTCTGISEKSYDATRTSYDKLFSCISDTCMVQLGICKTDEDCLPCLDDKTPEYCRTNDNYNSLVDCTLCNCVPKKPDYCAEKKAPSVFNPNKKPNEKAPPEKPEEKESNSGICNPEQTMQGASAVLQYSTCSDIEQGKALIMNWDENNFGPLDEFESCSHTFNKEYAHGGKKALDCMRILESIVNTKDTELREDIWSIANSLYHEAEKFCECTKDSNDLCPSCDSFNHFKILLHESLDACVALDEIDCAAWTEFSQPCKDNMYDKFGKIDFDNKVQCEYIHSECGGVGPFPAFRRLDCGSEISKPAWDFYTTYSRGCLKDDDNSPGEHSNPTPITPKIPEKTPMPTNKPPTKPYPKPSGDSKPEPPGLHPVKPTPKPYIPISPASSTSSSSSSSSSSSKSSTTVGKTKHHYFLKFTLIGSIFGIAFYVYKKRHEDFDFQRYRRRQRMYNQPSEQELYSNLTGSMTSSFEPPTLPPDPSPNNGAV